MHRIHIPGISGTTGHRRKPSRSAVAVIDRAARPMDGFTEVADLSTDLIRALLRVDIALLVRITADGMTTLSDSPRLTPSIDGPIHGPEATPVLDGMLADGIRIDGLPEMDPHGDDVVLARAVHQVAVAVGCEGSAGAGMYDHEGRLIGMLAVFSARPFTGDPTAFARVLRHHTDELGPLLEQETADILAGRADGPAAG